ncbi:run domain Beclin-1-interacting and cysteine-rich domain-containing protein-like [Daphnia carinata]|uniref:run domain Beclin-1-interacting and cysteine-rich domain-containing protein-like n=1 Tax=Daphnia carinata TaxID=120202 RepID=UPI00257F10A3|nr:run domain Beclin-1-interacting and cysteine-rich domain-containing protein-like [Daphnia carinata]
MTMIERENENISAVNTGCIPKVALLPVKAEISATNSFLDEPIGSRPDESSGSVLSEIKMAVKNSYDPHPNLAIAESVKAPATHHRSKHVRSFSDCTGLSSTSYEHQQVPSFTQARNTCEKATDGSSSLSRPRFLEDGGSSIVVAAGGHEYPKRQRGQSLVDYLMSNQSKKIGPELDRENAHFSVSEAMIAAIEETKFYRWTDSKEDEEDDQLIKSDLNDESDEEIRQMKFELQSAFSYKHFVSNAPTDCSMSPESSVSATTPPFSPSSSLASAILFADFKKNDAMERIDSGISFTSFCSAIEKERRRSRKLARLRRVHSRLISRMNSGFQSENPSDATTVMPSAPIAVKQHRISGDSTSRRALFTPSPPSPVSASTPSPSLGILNESTVSAENVALNLLGHFSQLRLPNESDMEWLVSEKDAPQHLLPMPQSWPINPDDPFMQLKENEIDEGQMTNLRGNSEWAPPRPQIVFAVYTSPNLKVVMAKQNYRCAGCGMRVEPEHSHNFRYCHYLGRYFCTACHSNKTFVVPSRIFKKWDFRKYPVSNFSYDLLERMWFDPLFRLGYINPLLYRRCRQLNKVLELRLQLINVAEFLRICRFGSDVWEEFRKQAADWLEDPEIYSLYDLTRVNSGELFQILRQIVSNGMKHIIHCELCKARGFLCEKCHSSEVIFPFQVDTVIRCNQCGSCFHRPCWSTPASCPRCQRIARRSQVNKSPPT